MSRRQVRLIRILSTLACFCLTLSGCGGSGVNPLTEQPTEGVVSSAQNVRLNIRLADRTSTVSQLGEMTPIRVIRAQLLQGQQAVQQLEVEVEPEDTQATLGFTQVQPGTYTVVVRGLDEDGEVLAETSAELVVEFGRISRVTLVLRPGILPPPPPPPPLTLNGYFVQ